MILIIAISAIFLLYATIKYRQCKVHHMIKNLNSIPSYPIIGSLLTFYGKTPNEIYEKIITEFCHWRTPVYVWLLGKLFFVVDKPAVVQKIMQSPHCKSRGYFMEFFGLEYGMLQAEPHIWQSHRKELASIFSATQMPKFVTMFDAYGRKLVQQMATKLDHDKIHLGGEIGKIVAETQLKSLYNAEVTPSELWTLFRNTKSVGLQIGTRIIKSSINLFYCTLPHKLRYLIEDRSLFNEIYQILKPIRNHHREKYLENLKANKLSAPESKQISDLLIERFAKLEYDGTFQEQEICDEIITMFIAGTDTLSCAISNCILCLAMYPEVQEKCFQEIASVMPDINNDMRIEMLTKLTYTEMVIKECLRLLPTVPLLTRKTIEALHYDDFSIPAGTNILMPVANIHRKRSCWGDRADDFYPEHFTPENIAARHRCAYLPFGYGIRNCIAEKFANYQLKIMIIHLIRNFWFTTPLSLKDLKFSFGVTLIVLNSDSVTVKKR